LKLDNETTEAIDEILRLNENDMNLSEMFFDEDRSSAALAYSCYGGGSIPQSFDIPKIDSKSSLDGADDMKTSGIAPRPLPSQTKMFYTRTKPLPIPGSSPKKTVPSNAKGDAPNVTKNSAAVTSNNTMAQAIATAAAIATTSDSVSGIAQGGKLDKSTAAALSVQPTTASQMGVVPRPSTAAPQPSVTIPAASSSNVPTRKPSTSNQKVPNLTIPARPHPQPHHPQPAAPHYARTIPASHAQAKAPTTVHYAAAHATTKASLAYAQAQRSSYGYGANHRVVGVPAPPPNSRGFPQQPTAAIRHHPVTGAPYVPIYTTPIPPVNVKPLASPAAKTKKAPEREKKSPPADTEDEAYERKKQRAKDARVRLNESIEELGVAIELAGSQSRERLHNHAYSTRTDATSDPAMTPLQKVMADTITQAENAKKWDRPAFVGLAATLIHSLNAQCEGLMRELLQLRREKEQWRSGNVSPDASSSFFGTCPTSSNNTEVSEPSSKRRKVDDTASVISGRTILCNDKSVEEERQQIIQNVAESSKILDGVAQFLDPVSLCRCLCVSKKWVSLEIFQNQQTWLSLCYKRFGAWSVRKWEGDEDDEEEASANHASPSMDLYCRMSEGNVKPYCSLDGSIFLGGSSLDGVVSGWASLVERSNGETSRSVVLTKIVDGKPQNYYSPIPVVELRILVQNTGYSNGAIYIPDQQFSVDASTRRKGEKLLEVTSDDRFKRRVIHVEKAKAQDDADDALRKNPIGHKMCQLKMFEYAVLSIHIHARGCSTTSKFCHRGKNIQVLVSINGTTRPLVVPISGQR
jgi:hypothetical protein